MIEPTDKDGRAGSLVVLTGASGSGKTAIALAIEKTHPEISVFRFDTIRVPPAEVMATFGEGHQPGGAWQRAMTLKWFDIIAPLVGEGKRVLFEGQMRIAFVQEALARHGGLAARIVLVECDDATRDARLIYERKQPELANESMRAWSRYLHDEAVAAGCDILDTTGEPLAESVASALEYLKS